MDYIDLIQKTINYIEDNITEKITVEELAGVAGFSTYHYYRVFYNHVGMTVMEYTTRRKLEYSLNDLGSGMRIMDIAFKYGFETHAGFNKAFKKAFGYSPNYYRTHAPVGCLQKIDLKKLMEHRVGGIIMEPKIMNREAIKIVGYKFETTLRNNAHSRDIPAFWDQCNIEGKEARLYATQNPPQHGEYCVCVNTDMETDEFSYVLGVEVEGFEKVEADMFTMEIPAATYAVFATPAVDEAEFVKSIQGTWRFILQEWFPNSGYEIDESKLDFEFYNEECHPWDHDKVRMYIYVPVIKR